MRKDVWRDIVIIMKQEINNARKYVVEWYTKYRRAVLCGEVAECVRFAIRTACKDYEIAIIKGFVGKNNIKIAVSAPNHFTLPVLMQRIKGKSAYILVNEYPLIRTIIP